MLRVFVDWKTRTHPIYNFGKRKRRTKRGRPLFFSPGDSNCPCLRWGLLTFRGGELPFSYETIILVPTTKSWFLDTYSCNNGARLWRYVWIITRKTIIRRLEWKKTPWGAAETRFSARLASWHPGQEHPFGSFNKCIHLIENAYVCLD